MKNWYELSKDNQRQLKKEFNSKKKVIDLRIILYSLVIISWIPCMILIVGFVNNECSTNDCKNNMILYVSIFILLFALAIINSLYVDKHKKAFDIWLKSKNIEK